MFTFDLRLLGENEKEKCMHVLYLQACGKMEVYSLWGGHVS